MSKSRRNKNKKAAEAGKGSRDAVDSNPVDKQDAQVVAESSASGQADAENRQFASGSAETGYLLESGQTDHPRGGPAGSHQTHNQDANAQPSESDPDPTIFSADEVSAMDAQLSNLDVSELAASEQHDMPPTDIEPSAVEAESGWMREENTSAIDVESPVIDVESSAAGNRRGKRRGKHAASAPPAAEPTEAEAPREPRIPAFEQLGEYERLSLAHIAGTPQQSDAPGHWRGVGFRLGQRRLAAAFDEVVEILSMPQVTHVPGAQPWMLGVANVRGTLLPVVDLKQFLEGERTVIHEAQRILVVRQGGGNVAVLIDELFGQRSFNDAQKVVVDDDSGRYGYFVKQMYRVDDFDWGVFSMSMLTRTPEFRQAAA